MCATSRRPEMSHLATWCYYCPMSIDISDLEAAAADFEPSLTDPWHYSERREYPDVIIDDLLQLVDLLDQPGIVTITRDQLHALTLKTHQLVRHGLDILAEADSVGILNIMDAAQAVANEPVAATDAFAEHAPQRKSLALTILGLLRDNGSTNRNTGREQAQSLFSAFGDPSLLELPVDAPYLTWLARRTVGPVRSNAQPVTQLPQYDPQHPIAINPSQVVTVTCHQLRELGLRMGGGRSVSVTADELVKLIGDTRYLCSACLSLLEAANEIELAATLGYVAAGNVEHADATHEDAYNQEVDWRIVLGAVVLHLLDGNPTAKSCALAMRLAKRELRAQFTMR